MLARRAWSPKRASGGSARGSSLASPERPGPVRCARWPDARKRAPFPHEASQPAKRAARALRRSGVEPMGVVIVGACRGCTCARTRCRLREDVLRGARPLGDRADESAVVSDEIRGLGSGRSVAPVAKAQSPSGFIPGAQAGTGLARAGSSHRGSVSSFLKQHVYPSVSRLAPLQRTRRTVSIIWTTSAARWCDCMRGLIPRE